MTVGVTVVCGRWIEGTAAVARHLALASTAATVVRSTGCVCCAVRPDIDDVVGALARRRVPPRHVVVEALPHDDPPCVAQTLLAEPGLRGRVALDALVVVLPGRAG